MRRLVSAPARPAWQPTGTVPPSDKHLRIMSEIRTNEDEPMQATSVGRIGPMRPRSRLKSLATWAFR
jgi:hypothetical protein